MNHAIAALGILLKRTLRGSRSARGSRLISADSFTRSASRCSGGFVSSPTASKVSTTPTRSIPAQIEADGFVMLRLRLTSTTNGRFDNFIGFPMDRLKVSHLHRSSIGVHHASRQSTASRISRSNAYPIRKILSRTVRISNGPHAAAVASGRPTFVSSVTNTTCKLSSSDGGRGARLGLT